MEKEGIMTSLRRNLQNQNWECFVCNLKLINTFLKNGKSIVKKIIWKTQKWHPNFSRPIGLCVIDQKQNFACLINNSRTNWPIYHFSVILQNLLQDNHLIFQKNAVFILRYHKNMLNFALRCSSPLRGHCTYPKLACFVLYL